VLDALGIAGWIVDWVLVVLVNAPVPVGLAAPVLMLPCCAECAGAVEGAAKPARWPVPGPLAAAGRATPRPIVEAGAMAAVSGWDVRCGVVAGLTGVVVTGWLAAELAMVGLAGLTGAASGFTG
jgi:hypothetical protein